mmetsp:Transcript_57620/g.91629  ORF Transcript_57620/g.91629 Transcript_57620/m.91629 type:complete len:221 (+) Transcript_57620:774-1436(+)
MISRNASCTAADPEPLSSTPGEKPALFSQFTLSKCAATITVSCARSVPSRRPITFPPRFRPEVPFLRYWFTLVSSCRLSVQVRKPYFLNFVSMARATSILPFVPTNLERNGSQNSCNSCPKAAPSIELPHPSNFDCGKSEEFAKTAELESVQSSNCSGSRDIILLIVLFVWTKEDAISRPAKDSVFRAPRKVLRLALRASCAPTKETRPLKLLRNTAIDQ